MTDINARLQKGLNILFGKNIGNEIESIDEKMSAMLSGNSEKREIIELEQTIR